MVHPLILKRKIKELYNNFLHGGKVALARATSDLWFGYSASAYERRELEDRYEQLFTVRKEPDYSTANSTSHDQCWKEGRGKHRDC